MIGSDILEIERKRGRKSWRAGRGQQEIPSSFSRPFVLLHKTGIWQYSSSSSSFFPSLMPLLPGLLGHSFSISTHGSVHVCPSQSASITRCGVVWWPVCVCVCVPHVFQQVTFSLVLKVQSRHLLRVRVFQLLCHFDLEETKREDASGRAICRLFFLLFCTCVPWLTIADRKLNSNNINS